MRDPRDAPGRSPLRRALLTAHLTLVGGMVLVATVLGVVDLVRRVF